MTCMMALVASTFMIQFWCTLRIIHNPQRVRDVPCQGCLLQQHQDNIKGHIVLQDEEDG